jgi:hypothetical protein
MQGTTSQTLRSWPTLSPARAQAAWALAALVLVLLGLLMLDLLTMPVAAANNPQQSWGFGGEPPEAVMKDSGTRDDRGSIP